MSPDPRQLYRKRDFSLKQAFICKELPATDAITVLVWRNALLRIIHEMTMKYLNKNNFLVACASIASIAVTASGTIAENLYGCRRP